jgi:DNA ligase-1
MNSDQKFEALMKVRQASGARKLSILAEFPDLQALLKTTYDPFIRFYVRERVTGEGTRMFDAETSTLLRKLSSRQLSGGAARSAVRTYMKSLTPNSAALFAMILDKNCRIGIAAKQINKVWPNLVPEHGVMLAHKFEASRCRFPMLASLKIDGVRATWIAKRQGFFSRNGHEYYGLGHLIPYLPTHLGEIDGELYIPGKTFQESSGDIRSSRVSPDAVFLVFDLPGYASSFTERYLHMLHTFPPMHEDGPPVKCVGHHEVHSSADIKDYLDWALRWGYEGLVLKTPNYAYQRKRSWDWMKLKPSDTADLVVVGAYEGEDKNAGKLGGITVRYGHKLVNVGTGFSDEQRAEFWPNFEPLLGRVVEVEFMEETDGGSLRHPVFKGFRYDKDSGE